LHPTASSYVRFLLQRGRRSLIADLYASVIFDQIISFVRPRRRLSSAPTASAQAVARRRCQDWPPFGGHRQAWS
jgi:hypothetical protein